MISVVIPAFNEEKRIGSTLEKIKKYFGDKKHEIIVVDDGSTDGTVGIVNNFDNIKLIRNEKNMGKGYSVKRGILAAKGDYILFMDADFSTSIKELDRFLKFVKDYDILIGSRNLKNSKIVVKQSIIRRTLGKIFPLLINLFLISDIKDTQCGFKLFKKNTAKDIFSKQTINRFAFDVETLYVAKEKGYKIKELPVTWRNSDGSKVKILRDPFEMFLSLIKIKLNHLKGVYN